MASGALGGTLRHLRDLFDEGTTVGLGDGQLLARYAAARDEAAFEALVALHGPMVLATCRAILRNEHDVEDAFQATFLVLARKARSIRGGDALGGWLHRVAYRVSVQAGAESRRRLRREAEAAAMTTLAVTHAGPEPDIASIVHEELDRLPDRLRLAVVLCDLEGFTYEQAAGRLRWTEPTLRHRLVRARHRLRERLIRRGVTAGAVSVVLAAQAAGAKAAVPAALARSAVAAATTGTASITVAGLSAAIIRGMAMTPLKSATTALMAAIALATAGALAVGSWRVDPPRAAMPAQAVGEMKRPPTARDAAAPTSVERIEVRVRVVDPRGRPVPGAAVRTFDPVRDVGPYRVNRPFSETTSGPDGRFRLRVRSRGTDSLLRRSRTMYPWIVVSAPGFGPGWASAVRQPGAPDETTVRLVEDGPPIEGQIVDLERRPVAGARVEAGSLWFAREGSVSAWLDRAEDVVLDGPSRGLIELVLPASIVATTGPDGRFRLTSIGRDRLAQVVISGPTIATAQLYVANRDGETIRIPHPSGPKNRRITYYPRRFEYFAEPTRPITGTIRDQDTGRPIAGVLIRGAVNDERSFIWAPGVEAETDARGHYRLTGLPRGPSYRLSIEPGPGQPYTWTTFVTPAGSPALEPIAFDIALKRGVLVRGRVSDKATGRPVWGCIYFYAFADNPHVDEFPGYRESYQTTALIGEDGRYEVVALPGRGLIACCSDFGRYLRGVGAATIIGGFITVPQTFIDANHFHVLAEINPEPGAETATLDLQVDPGRSLIIHAVDPEGRPLGGTRASGVTQGLAWLAYEQDSPAIEVHALDPSKPRRVILTHDGRKLVGSVYLKGDEVGPLTVRLQPSGAVTGRIVDEEGRPRGGLALSNPPEGSFAWEPPPDRAILPGGDFNPGILVGRDGRFRVEGLIPGLKYGAYARRGFRSLGDVFHDLTVAPGEVKDLGDIKVGPYRRDN